MRLVLVAGLLFAARTAPAAEGAGSAGSVTIEHVVVGLNGAVKVGRWASLTATVQSDTRQRLQLVVESVDPDGNPTFHESAPVDVPAGKSSLTGLFELGRLEPSLRVHVRRSGEDVAYLRVNADSGDAAKFDSPLRLSTLLVGVLGEPGGLTNSKGEPSALDKAPIRLAKLDAGQLPTNPLALESLDVLLVAGLPNLTTEAQSAVEAWVRRGGHIVVCTGSEAERFSQSAWSWLPIPIIGSSRLRELSSIEGFSGKAGRIQVSGSIRAARLGPVSGDVRITGLDGPLLVRVPLGFGRVSFFGLDIDRPPLAKWEPLGELLRKVIYRIQEASKSSQSLGRKNQIAGQGLTDLETQLRSAQDTFPGLSARSNWSVMGLILVYILLLGPIDYLLVHRLLKRPQWTWFTFPALVVVATGGAVVLAGKANGNTAQVSQIDVVDVDITSGLLRGRSSASLYSPRTERFAVEWKPATQGWIRGDAASRPAALEQARISWDGLPEDSFGGMYRAAGVGVARPGYRFDPDGTEIPDLPIPIWATKSLVATWDHPAPGLAESDLKSPLYGQLAGSFTHHLPGDLTEWVIAYGNRVYLPAPGVTGNRTRSPRESRGRRRESTSSNAN